MVFEEPYRFVLKLAFIGALFALLRFLSYRERQTDCGWHLVRPGVAHWFCVVVFSMFVVVGLAAGAPSGVGLRLTYYGGLVLFGICTTYSMRCLIGLYKQALAWQGDRIAFSPTKGARQVLNMRDIAALDESWTESIVISFADGRQLKIDPHARGSERLLEVIHETIPLIRLEGVHDRWRRVYYTEDGRPFFRE